MSPLPLLARFNRWVNPRLYDTVAGLPDDVYRADHGAFFGSVHAPLYHLLLVDRLWCARVRGVDHGFARLDLILHDDFAGLRAAREAEDDRIVALVDGLSADDLERWCAYRAIIGTAAERTQVGHILLGMFNHQTHHRGQVHAVLTRHGLLPPPLDLIFFLEDQGLGGAAAPAP